MPVRADQSYESEHHFWVDLAGERLEVTSKPGLPDWDQLYPSAILLAENTVAHPADHLIQFGCHNGALSAWFARKFIGGQLSIIDQSFIALEMTRKTLEANVHPASEIIDILPVVELPVAAHHAFNVALIQAPKGRSVIRRWLLQACQALVPGGSLFIAGSNQAGIQSAIKDAYELFRNVRILAYKKGNRIAQCIKEQEYSTDPAWAHSQGIAPATWVEFSVAVNDSCYPIRSLPGVFSFDHLDSGTEMLLNATKIPQEANVLDVGCGYGIIGLYAATHGARHVDMVDCDLLAITSSIETLAINRVTNANVYFGDLLSVVKGIEYDVIISNPPFHAGIGVDYQASLALIRQAHHALRQGGQLVIVANRFIPYDHLIGEIFGNISCLEESGKFHVLSGIKYT
jgi:16S rRNA (guanine1207-N2)-methyltransferase